MPKEEYSVKKGEILSKNPIDSQYLSEQLNSLLFQVNKDGNLKAIAVIPFDISQNPNKNRMPIVIQDGVQGPVIVANVATGAADLLYNQSSGLVVQNLGHYYNPVTTTWEPVKTPSVYKNVWATAAGSTAIWTSGVGKKWRLMGIVLTMAAASTTAAGPMVIKIYDVAADIGIGITLSVAAMALTVTAPMVILTIPEMKNGILAAATNTALNINLSNAFTTGGISVQVWGTEE
jgi:hypothetical protein